MADLGSARRVSRARLAEDIAAHRREVRAYIGANHIRDLFDGAQGTLLVNHAPNEGPAWTSPDNSASQIDGNGRVELGTGNSNLIAAGVTSAYISIVNIVGAAATDRHTHVGFRLAATSVVLHQADGAAAGGFSLGWTVAPFTSGTGFRLGLYKDRTKVAESVELAAPGAGDWIDLEIAYRGAGTVGDPTIVHVWLDGVQRITHSDAADTFAAQTQCGLGGTGQKEGSTTPLIEEFFVTSVPSAPHGAEPDDYVAQTDLTPAGIVPGAAVVVKVRVGRKGSPLTARPNKVNIRLFVDDGATGLGGGFESIALGGNLDVAYVTTSNWFTTANGAAGGGDRCGMYRVRAQLINDNDGVEANRYTVDSDGVHTLPATTTADHGRGYFVAPTQVTSIAVPASLRAYPDVFTVTTTLAHQPINAARRSRIELMVGGVAKHSEQSIADWTTQASTTDTADNAYPAASTGVGVRVELSDDVSVAFQNDPYIVADALPAGYVFEDTISATEGGRVVKSVAEDRFTLDPRLSIAHLLQVDDASFATPPLSADRTTRLTYQLGFLAARLRNARAEGQNAINATLKNWDTGELKGSETSPVNTTTQNTRSEGGESGWLATTTDKLPLSWEESLPTGSWTVKAVINTPLQATGLESAGVRTVTLFAPEPKRFPAIHVPDEVAIGVAIRVIYEYHDASTGLPVVLDEPPKLLIFGRDAATGAVVPEFSEAPMTQFGATNVWFADWVPSGPGRFMVRVRAKFQGGDIVGSEAMVVRARFAVKIGPLADRMG